MKLKNKGFTLIELLVVIAIISILASIIFIAIKPKDQTDKAKDVKRMEFVNQLTQALDMYNLDKGYYPRISFNTYNSDGGSRARFFENELKEYMTVDFTQKYLHGWGNPDIHETSFLYRSSDDDNYNTYGIGIILKKNNGISASDGGYYGSYYELGARPSYCRKKYSGSNGNWWYSGNSVCKGGN